MTKKIDAIIDEIIEFIHNIRWRMFRESFT